MRLIVPLVAVLIAGLSAFHDLIPPSLASQLCLQGACRVDQVLAAVDAAGDTPKAVGALVDADPANPLVWCTYAEVLAAAGDAGRAEAAFDHAVSLGPEMPPVLMRVANYDFTHGRHQQGLLLTARILRLTNLFDEILFSYLLAPGIPAGTLLGGAIPMDARPARSWLRWVSAHGQDQEAIATWVWMKKNRLLDEKLAGEVAWTLWNRRLYSTAWTLWRDDSANPQLLANNGFAAEPVDTPFDWTLNSVPAAAIVRQDGLEIRFSGAENLAFFNVHQFAMANPGHYRFWAEVSSDSVSTDQRPFFRIYDPAESGHLSVLTAMVDSSAPKSRISAYFTVTGKPEPLLIELDRVPSQRFDNRIAGTFHVYRVSLERLP